MINASIYIYMLITLVSTQSSVTKTIHANNEVIRYYSRFSFMTEVVMSHFSASILELPHSLCVSVFACKVSDSTSLAVDSHSPEDEAKYSFSVTTKTDSRKN